MISKFNGDELDLDVEDVRDHFTQSEIIANSREQSGSRSASAEGQVVFDAGDGDEPSLDGERPKLLPKTSRMGLRSPQEDGLPDYSSTGEHNVSLTGHAFQSPVITSPTSPVMPNDSYLKDSSRRNSTASAYSARSFQQSQHSRERSSSTLGDKRSKLYWKLPRWLRKPMWAWAERMSMVLSPEWIRTTILVWIAWFAMSLGESICCPKCVYHSPPVFTNSIHHVQRLPA